VIDNLISKPLTEDFQTLPSPEQLKYKVLVRSPSYTRSKLKPTADPTEPNHPVLF
ncbi:unnamed protein product, partial [Rotaria magnacalcarata]